MEKPNLDQEHVEHVDQAYRQAHHDANDLAESDTEGKVTASTLAAVGFLGFTFQSSLTFTVLFVFPVITPIALELSGSTANSNWLASGWSLSGSIAFAIAGQLSDYLGRRWLILTGQIMLLVGHVIGATAQTLNQCIAAMAILGLGTGTTFVLYPGISEILPNKYRPLGLAWTEVNLLPFTTLGPLLARLLVEHASWRWIFILGAITGAIALIGTAVFYFPPPRPIAELTRWQIIGQLDFLGIFLHTAGLTLFLLGLGWGGTTYRWDSPQILATLCTGGCLVFAMIIWDLAGWAQRPLFPRRLMRMFRKYTSLLLVIFVTGVVYFTLTALMPLQIQYTLTKDPMLAGIYNIPGGFGGAAGGVLLGGLIAKIGHVHWQLAAGVACQTVFTALQALCRPGNVGMLLVFQFFANVVFAWITLACYVTAGLHVPQEDLGLALGLVGTSRFLGSAVDTTIYSRILNSKAVTSVSDHIGEAITGLGSAPMRSRNSSRPDTWELSLVFDLPPKHLSVYRGRMRTPGAMRSALHGSPQSLSVWLRLSLPFACEILLLSSPARQRRKWFENVEFVADMPKYETMYVRWRKRWQLGLPQRCGNWQVLKCIGDMNMIPHCRFVMRQGLAIGRRSYLELQKR